MAGKRGENRAAKHAEDLETGQKALLQQRAHFEEEKLRLERLKAQLAAEPAVLKGDDMDTDLETAESLAEKELVLRRMAPAKVDGDGTSLLEKRRKSKSEHDGENGRTQRPVTTLDSTPRLNLLERGRGGGRLAGRLRSPHGIPLSVGKRGDPGGLQNAGQPTFLSGGTRWFAKSLWTKLAMLSVHLPHSVSKTRCRKAKIFVVTDQEREYCWAWTAMWAWQEFGTKTW